MILGKSISLGSGFRLINYPENSPDYKAYPGFPLILSFFYFILGSKFIEVNILIVSKIIVFTCFILSVLFFYLVAKKDLDRLTLLLATIFFITHPELLSFSSKVMTETVYNLFILITLYFFSLTEKKINKDNNYNTNIDDRGSSENKNNDSNKKKKKNIYKINDIIGEYLRDKNFLLLIFFSIFTFLIRPIGIFIILAIFIQIFLSENKIRSGIYFVFTLVPVILWNLRVVISNKVSYVSEFFKVNLSDYSKGDIDFIKFFERAKSNFDYYFKAVFSQLTNGLKDILKGNISNILRRNIFVIKNSNIFEILKIKDLHFIAILVVIIFVILGIIYFLKRRKYIYILYFIFYFVGLLMWPWQSERLTICVIPILIILFSSGVLFFKKIILKISTKKIIKIFASTVLILTFIIFLVGSTYSGYFVIKKSLDYKNKGIFIYSKQWENFYDAMYWLKENSYDGSSILSRSNFLVYILTGRETIAFPYSDDEQKQKKYLNKSNFIIQDKTNERFMKYVYPIIEKYKENFKTVYEAGNGGTVVYERLKKLD
ncbi:MAG: glycosyltransferase family 39 protein [Actinobacteria bacterium]|nr:glycosyltransferase family 39 protein [Actinomycetota bacterium]